MSKEKFERKESSDVSVHSRLVALSSQVKGRAVKIRPKTKDWLKGWQEEIIRKRDSMASMSPTANSCLLEENFDFTSLDYESEGEYGPYKTSLVTVARRSGQTFRQLA